ncbi:MAG: PPE family protein [Mycobacterium sp.]|uniref:PPE family protein n=1 Tax=Mycobacterium sp. TaxID=1785 RepID=UPI00262316DC|nr:PPE family protein [Mycobacterium sp.]MDI3315058.1 PPE family protein [Mycobacterium sp.]
MTAPVWMAFPPEVHSALLSSGPGPGSLLAAAGAWTSLSTEYASVAEELGAILSAVQAGAWQGPSAESYIAAHVPYLAWLTQASANSAAVAAGHETAAAAYTGALAAMPTLAELAANHATHAVLVATNFFGINTIPIALNEADYARMWVQAATTMSTYHAVSTAAVAAAPHTDPAPQIQKSTGNSSSSSDTQDIIDNDNGNPGQLSWWINRVLEILLTLRRDFSEFPSNPSGAISQLLSDIPALIADEFTHVIEAITYYAPELTVAALGLTLANPASGAGFAGLAGLAAVQPVAPVVAPTPAPVAAAPLTLPAPVIAPVLAAPVAAPATAPAPAPAPAPSTVVSSPPAPPPTPPVASAGFMPPYAIAPPGIGVDSGMSASASAAAKRKTPTPETAATAAAAAAREQARARRRRRAKRRGYGDEFMDMNIGVDPDWGEPLDGEPVIAAVSDRGAGNLGFAGTARQEAAGEAAGLLTLVGDAFGEGPTTPMVPASWHRDGPTEKGAADD